MNEELICDINDSITEDFARINNKINHLKQLQQDVIRAIDNNRDFDTIISLKKKYLNFRDSFVLSENLWLTNPYTDDIDIVK